MINQDYRLGLRMLAKFPGLTIAGGLALAIAIGIGAGWYDISNKLFAPKLPLPAGDRVVLVEMRNVLTSEPERRVAHDLLAWRQTLRTFEALGAYHTLARNLTVGDRVPAPIQTVELTADAFRIAQVAPLLGRGLQESDDVPGAPDVVVIGYDVWQRLFAGRDDAVGSVVRMGNTAATVIGVMPEGFRYPVNDLAWTPLHLQAAYGPLEGGPITVIGRLAPGVTRAQAGAELHAVGQHAADRMPATHKNLRPRVTSLGLVPGVGDLTELAITNLPALLVMLIACINVGTLVYARTATREGEIALRSALGASRSRIVGQLFVEALILSLLAAAVGLGVADRVLRWGIDQVTADSGGPPFWVSPGLSPTTIVYAVGLAVLAAALLSLMPALKVTRARVQSHLIRLSSGGATLRFGRVWTTAMIVQVAITVIAIPVIGESMNEMLRKVRIRAEFPSQQYLAARLELDAPFAGASTPNFAAHRAQVFAEFEERLRRDPGVATLAHADLAPGGEVRARVADIDAAPGAAAFDDLVWTSAVGPDFFETFDSAIIAGRDFDRRDRLETAHSVIVNQAFAARFSRTTGRPSPVGARLRYTGAGASSTDPWFEVVGVARNIGLDPEDRGPCCEEAPYVYHAASLATMTPFIVNVRVRDNPAPLVARLPALAAAVDTGLRVEEARTLEDWIGRRNAGTLLPLEALTAVTLLALFLSALGIFSLMSVSVSRRTREIGLRSALGASPRNVIGGIVSHAVRLMGGGIAAGGFVLLLAVSVNEDNRVPLFVGWLAITSALMFVAGVFACLGPTRRALRISPTDALRET